MRKNILIIVLIAIVMVLTGCKNKTKEIKVNHKNIPTTIYEGQVIDLSKIVINVGDKEISVDDKLCKITIDDNDITNKTVSLEKGTHVIKIIYKDYKPYSFSINVSMSTTVEIVKEGNGTINPQGAIKGYKGKKISLRQEAAKNNNFVGWYIIKNGKERTLLSKDAIYEYTMDSDDKKIIAVFKEKQKYKLTVTCINGSVEGNNQEGYYNKEIIVLKAIPDKGYEFVSWEKDGKVISNDIEYQLTMLKSDITIKAIFRKKIEKDLKVVIEGQGSINDIKEKYFVGEEVSLSATAKEGHTFHGWYDETKQLVLSTSQNYKFKINNNTTIYAIFYNKDKFKLKVISEAPNTLLASYDGEYKHGQKIELTLSSNSNYVFKGWYMQKSGEMEKTLISENMIYSFRMPDFDCYLTAQFDSDNKHVLDVTHTEGFIEITGNNINYSEGENINLKAILSEGFVFVGWFLNNYEEGVSVPLSTNLNLQLEYIYNTDIIIMAVAKSK